MPASSGQGLLAAIVERAVTSARVPPGSERSASWLSIAALPTEKDSAAQGFVSSIGWPVAGRSSAEQTAIRMAL
jgi:hypothetical protein